MEKYIEEKTQKPLIIFDTDMETDCDDAGALAMLFEYVRRDRRVPFGRRDCNVGKRTYTPVESHFARRI